MKFGISDQWDTVDRMEAEIKSMTSRDSVQIFLRNPPKGLRVAIGNVGNRIEKSHMRAASRLAVAGWHKLYYTFGALRLGEILDLLEQLCVREEMQISFDMPPPSNPELRPYKFRILDDMAEEAQKLGYSYGVERDDLLVWSVFVGLAAYDEHRGRYEKAYRRLDPEMKRYGDRAVTRFYEAMLKRADRIVRLARAFEPEFLAMGAATDLAELLAHFDMVRPGYVAPRDSGGTDAPQEGK